MTLIQRMIKTTGFAFLLLGLSACSTPPSPAQIFTSSSVQKMTDTEVTILTVTGVLEQGRFKQSGEKTMVLPLTEWVVDPHVREGDNVFFLPHSVRSHGQGRITKDATDAVVDPAERF